MPYWRLYYHVVWSTCDRQELIGSEERTLITRSMRDTCNEHKAMPHAIGIMPDHVHIAVSLPPSGAISTFVGRLKGACAHAVNHSGNWPHPASFAWQGDYGVLSFSERALAQIVDYVQNQESRHAANRIWHEAELSADPAQPASAGLSESARGLQPRVARTIPDR